MEKDLWQLLAGMLWVGMTTYFYETYNWSIWTILGIHAGFIVLLFGVCLVAMRN